MSDFDKIINDRLNEDDGEFFPRREANWEKLSQRLADFESVEPLPTNVPKPVMRPVWKRWALSSAAAILVGVSGLLMWHFNEVKNVEKENSRLQQEVAALKSSQQQLANPDTIVQRKIIIQTDTIFRTTQTIVNGTKTAGRQNKSANTPDGTKNQVNNDPSVNLPNYAQKQADSGLKKQNAAIVDGNQNDNKKGIDKKESLKDAVIQKRNDNQLSQMDNKKALEAVPFERKNEQLNGQKTNLNDALGLQKDPSASSDVSEANRANVGTSKQNGINIVPKTGDDSVRMDRKNIENVETVVQAPPSVSPSVLDKKDSLENAKSAAFAFEKAKEDSLIKARVALQETKSNAESASATPPIIKTDKGLKRFQKFLPKGFAVGLNGVYGSVLPDIPGLKATTGMGVAAELMLTKNISLTATGDLLETHFELRERPNRFHLPDAPDPNKPNVGLHHIKGDQHSRLLSVNAKYIVSQKWWIQPFVTVGHSWLKVDEHRVDFVFKDFTTGEETPKQTTVSPEKNKSLWQLGIGLEKKIKRWTFGVSGEMQKDFMPKKDSMGKSVASSLGILRGGVKFNIF